MWDWSGGFWSPGVVLMAVFCIVMMLMMFRMMGSMGGRAMCGFWRWFDPRDDGYADERARRDRRIDVDSPEGER